MKEDQLNTLREQDKNLRDAIRMEEMELPEMPANLNARLMQRVATQQQRKHRMVWPWVAAACVAGILMIWLTPPKEQDPIVAKQSPTVVRQNLSPTLPMNEKDVVAPKVPTEEEPLVARKIAAKPKKPSAEPIDTEMPVLAQEPLPVEDNALSEAPTEMLSESDIPITRPENYRYTPEELALMKKQANEAYLKWVELELEISKHYLEQTAQNE
ncbi:MAG: hypothetical protein J5682_07240 [Prevotella sp.]|nr:hypothetical protein [Prevotella sp.]